jgi:internalin A
MVKFHKTTQLLKIKTNQYMLITKRISALLGIIISSASVLLLNPLPGQALDTQSFTQWCQNKISVPAETRKTIDLLLKKAGTNNCQLANSKLTKLKTLSFPRSQITDLKPLASLTNLSDLYLDSNQISDIRPLASLTNLNALYLDNNRISDVKPLASLTNLTYLKLGNNQISDVKPLSSLTNLTWLNLDSNKISDVKQLTSLINLTHLYLEKNQIIKKICPVKPPAVCFL